MLMLHIDLGRMNERREKVKIDEIIQLLYNLEAVRHLLCPCDRMLQK